MFAPNICQFCSFKLSLSKTLPLHFIIKYNACIISIPDKKNGWPLEQQIMWAYIRRNKPNGVHTM